MPLCGEADLITFHERFDDEAVTVAVDGETLILEPLALREADRNDQRFSSVDHVGCLLCGARMPLRTWQGWRPSPAARQLYRAYYSDDDPQPWESAA